MLLAELYPLVWSENNLFFARRGEHSFSEEQGLCPEPGGLLGARESGAVFPYQLHDQVIYACDLCLPGGGTVTCLRSGQWSGSVTCAGILHVLPVECLFET